MFNTSVPLKSVAAVLVLAASVVALPAPVFTYSTFMDGISESPPNASPANGSAFAVYDSTARTLTLTFNFSGLLGTSTVAHIHGNTATPFTGTAGVVLTPGTLPGFPSGVTSGSYSNVLDLSLATTYPAAFITANGGTTLGAENAIMNGIAAGRAYLNIHSQVFPGGEIRGFFQAVPEPGALTLLLLGGVLLRCRRK